MKKEYKKIDKYEKLTEKILELINDKSKHLKFKDFIRRSIALSNPITGSHYNGGNVMNTFIDKMYNDYDAFEYVTYMQAKEKKLKMKKGAKSCPVYFYKKVEKESEKEEGESFLIMKRYNVFNLDCFELTDEQKEKYLSVNEVSTSTVKSDNEKIEKLKSLTKLEMTNVTRAFYLPSKDKIHMPSLKNFDDLDHWNEVFLHELTHWTGHEKRLDRKLKGKQDNSSYSKEELIAELGSFFLCLDLGIEKDLESGAAYLKSYLDKTTKKNLFESMNAAIKAVQFLYEKIGVIEQNK